MNARMPLNTRHRLPPQRSHRNFIASLEHGLSILEALATHSCDMPLATLATHVQLKKTTTWRLAHTLVHLGYLTQSADTRRFALAPRVLSLGYAYFDGLDLKQSAEPFLRDLSARVGETVAMAVLDADEIVYIERIKTSQVVNINLHVGSRLPIYNTSMGRALVAELPPESLRRCAERLKNVPAARKYVQDAAGKLFKIVKDTRQRGYALNDEEFVAGLRSIATPVRDKTGKALAAINISVPSARVSVSHLQRTYAPELLKTAAAISEALGFRPKR